MVPALGIVLRTVRTDRSTQMGTSSDLLAKEQP